MNNLKDKTVIVCDKDALTRARIIRVAQELGLRVVSQTSGGKQTVKAARQLNPDFVFIDLHMPEMDGSRCAREIAETHPRVSVIFTTKFDQFTIHYLNENNVSHVVKPVNKDQVLAQLSIVKMLGESPMSRELFLEDTGTRKARQHITARDRKGTVIVKICDIHCFVADQKYVDIHHKDGVIPTTETLKELEEEFGDLFMRVHRNAIISVNHLESIDAVDGGQHRVRLKGSDSKVTVSRRLLPRVREQLRAM